MKIAFDLDGTLDRPAVRDLALALLKAGHEVHILSGCFTEAGKWQDSTAKMNKLVRLGLVGVGHGYIAPACLKIMILPAVDHKQFDRAYRLVDLGLRKGAYCEEHGITLIFDDSEVYCETIPSMCGAQVVRVMR